MAVIRKGPLVNERVVKLSCGHEQNHRTAEVGDTVACLSCSQRSVTRSHLNLQTYAQPRKVIHAEAIPANKIVYSIGG